MKAILRCLVGCVLSACSLDKEVVVSLPPYQKELVTECYLERDKPVMLYLSESSSYFDTLAFVLVNGAQVALQQGQRHDTLPNLPFFDLEYRKLYNYRTGAALPLDTTQEILLSIKDTLGRTITGTTRFLPLPVVDSIQVRYEIDDDTTAGFLLWIQDFPGQTNYYRLIMNEDSLTGAPVVEFTITDNSGLDGKRIPVGTTTRFKPGKTMIIRVFHIEQGYYDYLRSVSAAGRANGNPFAQPATVKSQVKGGFGIFTTLNYREFRVPF